MAEPLLTAVFGANASQDINVLTIQKADLATVGLTADSANSAEALLAAILKLAANTLTTTNQQVNPDQSVTLQPTNTSVYESPFGTKLRQNYLVSFDNDFTNPGINPDSY